MRVRVKYLMWLHDLAGVDEEEIKIDRPISVLELVVIITKRHPKLKKYMDGVFSSHSLIIALVNGAKADPKLP